MIKRRMICLVLLMSMLISIVCCSCTAVQNGNVRIESTEREENEDSEDKPTDEAEYLSAETVEVSDREATVPYQGEEFIKSLFAVGETMLYVCGNKPDGDYFLGFMGQEEDAFREFTVDIGEDMRAFNMAVDEYGKCHILWMSVEKEEINGQSFDQITYEKSYITIINKEGIQEKEIDVSNLFSLEQPRPVCFVVDRDGNYYVECEKEFVQIMADGTKKEEVLCDGWIEGIGRGKTGRIYCIYREETGERRLARWEEDGTLYLCEVKLPEAAAIYAGIYPGTDTELLLFNKEGGVIACDESAAEVRILGSKLPVKGSEIIGYGILADGRTCLMEQKEGQTAFYYLPSGK